MINTMSNSITRSRFRTSLCRYNLGTFGSIDDAALKSHMLQSNGFPMPEKIENST